MKKLTDVFRTTSEVDEIQARTRGRRDARGSDQ